MFYLATYRRFPVFCFPCFILTASTELFQRRRATAYAIFDPTPPPASCRRGCGITPSFRYAPGFFSSHVIQTNQMVEYGGWPPVIAESRSRTGPLVKLRFHKGDCVFWHGLPVGPLVPTKSNDQSVSCPLLCHRPSAEYRFGLSCYVWF